MYIVFFVFYIVFIFRDVILHINSRFINWMDAPFVAWQIFITREKLINLDFANIYTTNSHYPYKGSLFFTDSFLGQSIMALPFFFIKNPILLHNIIFLITIFLNYIAVYLLFKKIFRTNLSGFLGSFFLNNSVYFFDQIIHMQTITYWPLIMIVYYLLELRRPNSFSIRKVLLAALFFSFQFYMSIYLGIFSLFVITVFFILLLFKNLLLDKEKIKSSLKIFLKSGLIVFIFLILTYPFLLKGYLDFEKTYHQVRDTNEILMTSTHFTDYIFFIKGTIYSSINVIQKYNVFNKHYADVKVYFPGFILILGFILGLFIRKIIIRNKKIIFQYEFNFFDVFFLLAGIVGFIFSLGPRLNANGKYLEIPLPYLLFLNKLDFLHSIRLTHRWSLLLILALVYFSVKFYSRFKKPILIFIILFFIFESVLINIKAEKKEYLDQGHIFLKQNAQKNEVLLEFPFFNLEKGIPANYETRILLASTYHGLKLVNGYTGLFIKDQGWIRILLDKQFPDDTTNAVLKSQKIDYLKINKKHLDKEKINRAKDYNKQNILYEDNQTLIIRNNYGKKEKYDVINSININPRKNGTIFLGIDKRFFLNLTYSNILNQYVSNLNQDKVLLKIDFLNNNKLIYRKEYYDLYPLIIYPKSEYESTLSFFVQPKFDKVILKIYNYKNKLINSTELNL